MKAPRKRRFFNRLFDWMPLWGLGLFLLTIPAGFLVVSWNLERAWDTYRKDAMADGQKLDLPPLAPSIPAAENLAAAPPFAPVQVDTDRKPLKPHTLANDWLPENLLSSLTDFQRSDFEKARIELSKGEPSPWEKGKRVAPDAAALFLRAFDRQLGAQWPSVLAAEAKPRSEFGIRYWPEPVPVGLPIADFRTAAQCHAIRALALLRLHRSAEALPEIHGGLRLAESLKSDPSMVALALRSGIMVINIHPIWEGLVSGRWTDSELASLAHDLEGIEVAADFPRAIDMERGILNAVLDSLAEESHLARMDQLRKWGAIKGTGSSLHTAQCLSTGIIRDNQLFINRDFDILHERIDSDGQWDPDGNEPIQFESPHMSLGEQVRYFLASILMPKFHRIEGHVLMIEARVRQARLAVAIERYRRLHGKLPENLDDLVPGLIPAIALDPIDSEPMRYAVESGGAFKLWSLGNEQNDDEGQPDPETDSSGIPPEFVWLGLAPEK